MLRYVIIATVLVFVVGALMTAVHRAAAPLHVATVASTGSPSPPRAQAASTFTPGPVQGDAPWAFDAVIDCFHHERTYRGTLAFVRRHIPAGAAAVVPGWTVVSADCTASITSDGVRLRRGPAANPSVVVRVPPPVQVFVDGALDPQQAPHRVYVLRWSGSGDARIDRLRTAPNASLQRTGI